MLCSALEDEHIVTYRSWEWLIKLIQINCLKERKMVPAWYHDKLLFGHNAKLVNEEFYSSTYILAGAPPTSKN